MTRIHHTHNFCVLASSITHAALLAIIGTNFSCESYATVGICTTVPFAASGNIEAGIVARGRRLRAIDDLESIVALHKVGAVRDWVSRTRASKQQNAYVVGTVTTCQTDGFSALGDAWSADRRDGNRVGSIGSACQPTVVRISHVVFATTFNIAAAIHEVDSCSV